MSEQLFNVEAVNIETGDVRIIAENKTRKDAIETLAVMRLGVGDEFYRIAPAQKEGGQS